MRLKLTLIPLLLLLAFAAMPASSVAKDKDTEHITISDPVMVAGTELKPGDYRVTWQGTGDVKVTFSQGDKVLVTTSAHLVIETSPYDGALQMKTTSNNMKVLEGIQWKKKALKFDQSGA